MILSFWQHGGILPEDEKVQFSLGSWFPHYRSPYGNKENILYICCSVPQVSKVRNLFINLFITIYNNFFSYREGQYLIQI